MSCLGSHKAKDTGRSYWSCLENNAVGDQAAHWEEGPEPRCSHLLDGGGGGLPSGSNTASTQRVFLLHSRPSPRSVHTPSRGDPSPSLWCLLLGATRGSS